MPRLKQLSCCIQWADTGVPFQEHGTAYGDGVVETFILVPNNPQGFSIRLTSQGFIHEGLVMVVFIDGNYQCNRSRVNLVPHGKDLPAHRTEIDFLMRQREKSQGGGIYLGREWRFDNHNIVTETPKGFQDSHFDDLGTIEVLVLRCRARNREEAEYEGSSSGEDSDIFANRHAIEEQTETTAAAFGANAKSSKSQEPVEEDAGLGLGGIFDGANDIRAHDDGYDNASGRWIWHQSRPPFAGFPEPSDYHQPEGYRFRSQSYARPPARYPAETYQDRRTFSGPAERRVHFDDVHTRRSPTLRRYGQTPDFHHPQPQRPLSRVRERLPSDVSQNRFTSTYDPQRISSSPNETGRYSGQDDQTHWQKKDSPYRDDPKPAWKDGNGLGNDTREYSQSRPPQAGQASNLGQGAQNNPSFSAQQANRDPNYASNQAARPDEAPTRNDSRRGSFYNSQHLPIGDTAQGHTQPPLDSYAPSTTRSGCAQYPPSNYQLRDQAVPASYPYTFPHTYDYPPHISHGYCYLPNQPMGYWPIIQPYPHPYSEMPAPSGTIPIHSMHPPHNFQPSFERQVSPLNVQGNLGHRNSSNAGDNFALVQEGHNGSQAWATNSNDNSGGMQNNSNVDNLNQNDAAGNLNDSNNQEAGEYGTQNNDANAADSNQKNDTWVNNDVNANSNNWGNSDGQNNDSSNDASNWNAAANDNNNNNDNNAWGETQDNQNDSWGDGTAANGKPDAFSLTKAEIASTLRDLYGPHGPYYALRAMRLGEPRPDAEEEPRYDVPEVLAMKRGSTKQVQPGPGYRYYKKRIVPEHIDTLESPYARFVFKYRTKDQLLNETGIDVEVEPSGNAEIAELQNLDKQALIEMLMRAKSALGGKVPSPTATPAPSTDFSEANAPVAIDAPKHNYLKYSLPPLRPNLVDSARKGSKASEKDTCSGWGEQKTNGGDGWGNNVTNKAKKDDWSWGQNGISNTKGDNWDGGKSPRQSTGPQANPQASVSSSGNLKKSSSPGVNGGNSAKSDAEKYPRPETPPRNGLQNKTGSAQNDNAGDNWDKAGDTAVNW